MIAERGVFLRLGTMTIGRQACAVVLCLLTASGRAQSSGQLVTPSEGTAAPSLFIRYSGAASMRLFGIAIGGDGSMYVVGGDGAAVGRDGYVSKVAPTGLEERFVAFKSRFVGPGVDIDADHNLFIACGDKILKVAANGGVEVLLGGFRGAFDLKLGPAGNLYVADHREGRIYRVTPSLKRTVLVDYHVGPGDFVLGGLAFDKNWTYLFSYEAAKKRLWRYPMKPDGTVGAPEVVRTDCPAIFSFDVDAAGDVLGADFDRGEVVRIDPRGNLTYLTEHCGLHQPIGFRLGRKGFHPGSAFVADADGITEVHLPGR